MNPGDLQEAERLCRKLAVVQTRRFQLSAAANEVRSIELRVGAAREHFFCAQSERALAETGQFADDQLIDDEDGDLKDLIVKRLQKCEAAIEARLLAIGCEVPPPWPVARTAA